MHKYVINAGYDSGREVEAHHFRTEGDYIDFYTSPELHPTNVVLRLLAKNVYTIERVNK